MHKRIGGALATALMLALLESCGGGSGGSTDPTHVDKDRPTLTSLSPASVPVGSPAFTLILNGSGFMSGGTVTWAGTNLGTYTFVSSTQVTMPIPASLVAKQGKVNIVVTNPGTGATPSDFISFDVTALTLSGCVLFGTYDFFFTGFDSTGPMTTAGAFGVDVSGKVSGEIDYKNRTETRVAEPVTGGMCTNGPVPNTGTLTITTASGTSTYTFASQGISPSDRGRMAESGDSNGVSGTGRFVFIHPGALAGDYVLAVVGADLGGQRMGIVGRFTDTGALSNGLGDINDNGTVTSSAVLTGSISAPDAYSRSTATVMIGGQTFHMAFYVLRPEAAFAIDVDPVGSGAIVSGFVDAQINAGRYGNANLGSPFVFSSWGIVAGHTGPVRHTPRGGLGLQYRRRDAQPGTGCAGGRCRLDGSDAPGDVRGCEQRARHPVLYPEFHAQQLRAVSVRFQRRVRPANGHRGQRAICVLRGPGHRPVQQCADQRHVCGRGLVQPGVHIPRCHRAVQLRQRQYLSDDAWPGP